jgi:hypothetical protein
MEDGTDNPMEEVLNSNIVTLPQWLQDVKTLTNDLKYFLAQHKHITDEEGIRCEIDILERWTRFCFWGFTTDKKIFETGIAWLPDLCERLKLAAGEMQKNSRNSEQTVETLLAIIGRAENIVLELKRLSEQR